MTRRQHAVVGLYRLNQDHLAPALDGVRFPAPRWKILAWAEHNGAGVQLRMALQNLPERTYRDITEIVREANMASASTVRAPRLPPNVPELENTGRAEMNLAHQPVATAGRIPEADAPRVDCPTRGD